MSTTHDPVKGEIVDIGVRYLMLRPDVLMGVAHELPLREAALFLQALENSAFRKAQASFRQYRARGSSTPEQLLAKSFDVAAHLGWGVWALGVFKDASTGVEVRNSPFAAGFGASTTPVCSAITGVLRAMLMVAHGVAIDVREVACAAQGAPVCQFVLAGLPIQPPGRPA